MLEVDLRGVVIGMRHAIHYMTASDGGSIINIASVAGLNASDRGTTTYSGCHARITAMSLPHGHLGVSRMGSSLRETPMFAPAPPPPQTGSPMSSTPAQRVRSASTSTFTSRLARLAPRQ